MPSGGPRRNKPTRLKALQGTYRADRANPGEPQPEPIAPDMPKGLDAYAKQAWKRIAPIAERMGTLTEADLEQFIAYCEAFSRYVRAMKRYRKIITYIDKLEGLELIECLDHIRKAELSVEKAEHSMRLLANEFGLTPVSRSRIDVGVSDDGEGVLKKLWSANR